MASFTFGSGTFGDFINAIGTGLSNFRFIDALDIIAIAFILVWLVSFFKRLGATQLVRGLLIVFIALYMVSNLLDLTMVKWLLDKLLISGFMFIAILFQPELRRALDHVGRHRRNFNENEHASFDELSKALKRLGQRNVGALVLIEDSENLQDIIDTGVKLDSLVTAELIENIFEDKTPLHDGAIIIRNGRIAAASCIIPLINQLPNVPQQFGTRHRAAVSATMKSDCLALIVSEETGRISYAREGILHSGIDNVQLSNLLNSLMEDNAIETSQRKLFELLFRKKKDAPKDKSEKKKADKDKNRNVLTLKKGDKHEQDI